MIIGVPVPHNHFVSWDIAKSFFELVKEGYEVVSVEGPYIYMNRNELINIARQKNESLLMIDSDMVFTFDDVQKIEGYVKEYYTSAYTGVYVNTRPPNPIMLFERMKGDYKTIGLPESPNHFCVDACGGGFMALSGGLIKKLPYECCNNVHEGDIEHGEDISLCHRINELGEEIWCDPSIVLGQLRVKPIYPDEFK